MAQMLSNKEIAYKTEVKTTTFINKILSLDGYGPDFKTEKGLFCSDFATVTYHDKTTKKYERQAAKKNNELLVQEYIARGPFVKDGGKVEVTGKFIGSKKTETLRVSKFLKTGEFGGQDGIKKKNLGIVFEKDFFKRLQECLAGIQMLDPLTKKGLHDYSTAVKYILAKTSGNELGGQNSPPRAKDAVEDTGSKNTSRPIKARAKSSLYIEPNAPLNHGTLLADVKVHHISGVSNLSLKYGSTLTFMNAGVMQIFKETEMKKKNIKTPEGINILAAFGIDEKTFCEVFNQYGKKSFKVADVANELHGHEEVTLTAKQNKLLKNLLSTGIGADYWMVHGQPDKSVNFYYMDKTKNDTASTAPKTVQVKYGGAGGRAKRVDVEFSNTSFDFSLNIRNKQSGVYPSHIMLDYTTKTIDGKTNITNSSNPDEF